MPRVTINDVALRAGVAGKTVSRLINGEQSISPKTRAKIEEAIAALNFRPNLAARALKSAKSYLIAILSNNPSPHYVGEVIRGASRVCRTTGYYLMLEEFAHDDENYLGEVQRLVAGVNLAGAILIPPLTDDLGVVEVLETAEVAYVRMSPALFPDRSHVVRADDAAGVTALAEHLWTIGHRSFGIVCGPPAHIASQLRHDAFVTTLRGLGGEWVTINVELGDFTYASGIAAGQALVEKTSRPTAIFASNDEMAAGVIAAVSSKGLSIPGDVAVAGFDDSEVARLIWPPLTTVAQSIAHQAKEAVEMLVTPQKRQLLSISMPVELIVRQSTIGS